MLVWLALLTMPADAVKTRTVVVQAVDAAGEPVSTAAVILDDEERRNPVDHSDGTWQDQAAYLLDGSVRPFVKGLPVSGWVVAPGYEPTRFSLVVRGGTTKERVRLPIMDVAPSAVSLPNQPEAVVVRRALSAASDALLESDRRRAKARLNEAADARDALEGPAYIEASAALFELRTLAALDAWDEREKLAHRQPGDQVTRAAQISRDMTGDLALQWLAYAREAGQPTERAQKLCLLATGRPSRCD